MQALSSLPTSSASNACTLPDSLIPTDSSDPLCTGRCTRRSPNPNFARSSQRDTACSSRHHRHCSCPVDTQSRSRLSTLPDKRTPQGSCHCTTASSDQGYRRRYQRHTARCTTTCSDRRWRHTALHCMPHTPLTTQGCTVQPDMGSVSRWPCQLDTHIPPDTGHRRCLISDRCSSHIFRDRTHHCTPPSSAPSCCRTVLQRTASSTPTQSRCSTLAGKWIGWPPLRRLSSSTPRHTAPSTRWTSTPTRYRTRLQDTVSSSPHQQYCNCLASTAPPSH